MTRTRWAAQRLTLGSQLSPRASGFLLQPSRREIIVARMAVNIVGREAEFACVRAFLERPADGLRALMLVRALKPLNGPS